MTGNPFRRIPMKIEIVCGCSQTDWHAVSAILKSVGMAYEKPEVHKKAFEASHTTVFVYAAGRLIGFSRALSDGAYQAAVYDVAVVPAFQRMGIGRIIMHHILDRLPGCNVILYASPGKEDFYRTLGMKKMMTGMALFRNPTKMADRGFTD